MARLSPKKRFKLCVLFVSKWLGLFRFTRWLTRKGFVIVGWHGVSIGDEHLRFPRFFITPQTLRNRLSFLHRHFDITSLDTAMQQHHAGVIKSSQVVLTFDDGMYDLKQAALPVLDEHRAPSTIYLVSDRLQRPKARAIDFLLHDVFLSTAIEELPEGSIDGFTQEHWHSTSQRRAASSACARHVKKIVDYEQRYHYLKSVAERLEVDLGELEDSRVWDILDSNEVREMMPHNVDFQLHSHVHLTVTELGENLEEDTRQCKQLIERETQRVARDYCYPSGIWGKWCWPVLQRVGIRGAVTCKLGPNFAQTPALALRRYIDEEEITQLEFEAMVSNFLWLIHAMMHPNRWYAPTEALSDSTSLY